VLWCSADALREEAGFRRGYDGHVVLLSRDGDPVEVRELTPYRSIRLLHAEQRLKPGDSLASCCMREGS
jgi:hypothetical protein